MKNKHVGYLVLGVAIIVFFIVISFNQALETIVNTSCTHGTMCPMQVTLQTQKVISYSLMGLLVLAGLFIIFFMKDETLVKEMKKKIPEEEMKRKFSNLEGLLGAMQGQSEFLGGQINNLQKSYIR